MAELIDSASLLLRQEYAQGNVTLDIGMGHLRAAGAVVSLWMPTRHESVAAADRLVPLQVTTHA